MKKYSYAKKLSAYMLNELIARIEVFQAEKAEGVWKRCMRLAEQSNRPDTYADGKFDSALSILSSEDIYPIAVNHASKRGINFYAIRQQCHSNEDMFLVTAAENLFWGTGAVNLEQAAMLGHDNFMLFLRALQWRRWEPEAEPDDGMEFDGE